MPGIGLATLFTMKMNKKWILCGAYVATGLACACIAIVDAQPGAQQTLKIALLMGGKFTISAGNMIMPVLTAELYPTEIRNAGVGACNFAAGFALILVPYLPVPVSTINAGVGFLVFCFVLVAIVRFSCRFFFVRCVCRKPMESTISCGF